MKLDAIYISHLERRFPGFQEHLRRMGRPVEDGQWEVNAAQLAVLVGQLQSGAIPTVPVSKAQRAIEQTRSFLRAMIAWARAGFGVVDSARYVRRKAVCLRCPHWEPEGWFGQGRCGKCGCSKLKLRLKGMVCPDQPPRWR